MSKYKRIDLSERISIQASIERELSLEQTAKRINRSPSSVYREIVNNSYIKNGRKTCAHCAKVCLIKPKFVGGECKEFIPAFCPQLEKYPYVCNKCKRQSYCRNNKRYYDCEKANQKALLLHSSTRMSKKFSNESDLIKQINDVLIDRINNRQGLYHIRSSNQLIRDNMSERTLRRYIYDGMFDVKAHNLPNYVKLSHKKREYSPRKKLNVIRLEGRTYKYYLQEINKVGRRNEFQYDSVIGLIDDKLSILTITHSDTNFQFGYVIEKGKSSSVNLVIKSLKELFGDEYKTVFKINLCDNGSEFENFYKNESIHENVKVFYTDPYKSYHKPECERNHEFIRCISHKHETLNNITQENLNLIFSHINSYIRKSLDGVTPYDLFVKEFGEGVVEKLNIRKINPKDVNLTPNLL